MIYQNIDHWAPSGIRLGKDQQTILSLANLNNIQPFIQQRSKLLNITPKQLRYNLEDGILSIGTLNLKTNILILPYQSFFRKFQPIGRDPTNNYSKNDQHTPYSFIYSVYNTNVTVGVSVDWQQYQKFIKEYKQKLIFIKVKIINFIIGPNNIADKFVLMRKIVNETFDANQKITYLISINLSKVQDLYLLRDQLITYNYPIEYISICTNLLNLIPSNDYSKSAYIYNQIIQKFIPSGVCSVVQTFMPIPKNKNRLKQFDYFLKVINTLNKRDTTQIKQNKRFYNSLAIMPQCFLAFILDQFHTTEGGQYEMRSYLDGKGFANINKAVQGKFKGLEQS